jgi:hypothetical protein
LVAFAKLQAFAVKSIKGVLSTPLPNLTLPWLLAHDFGLMVLPGIK